MPDQPEIGVIAISAGLDGKKSLAIFGSRLGFLGPVIQQYEPFEDEAAAIAAAQERIKEMGLPIDPVISRPRIDSIRITYRKPRKKAKA